MIYIVVRNNNTRYMIGKGITTTTTINFRGYQVCVPKDPRCGVCNGCRAIFGEVDAQTGKFYKSYHLDRNFALHHELYDFNDVLAHTLELCPKCHGKYNKEQKIIGTDKTQFFINYSKKDRKRRKSQQRPLIILPGRVV